MTKLEIEIHDNVIDIYNKIKDLDDSGIEIDIPQGSVLFDNTLNIKLLKKMVERDSKTLTLTTADPQGRTLLDMIEEGMGTPTLPYEEYTPKENMLSKLKRIRMPRPPKIGVPTKTGAILPIVIVVLIIGGGIYTLQKLHKASTKIIVEAQTLTRSITIKVKKGESNNFAENIIKGTELQETVQNFQTIETTGEKLTGTTAKGEITIYNKTTEEKKFKKGTVLIYDDGDNEYRYVTTSDVTVPARIDDIADPTNITLGEENVDIEAVDVGDEYNFDKDKNLELDDYKTSEFVAKSKEDIDGGKKETKQAVSKEDIYKVTEELTTQNTKDIQSQLEKQKSNDTKYIKGSETITVLKEEYSKELGNEATELMLDQTLTATALGYSQTDLENVANEALKMLVPNGYEISEKDKDIKVEVLGKSTNSILNSNEADLQVTIKTYVVPAIDEEKLKGDLSGKSVEDAQKVINNISNIKTYEIHITPSLPLFKKFPKDVNRISVEVEKE